MTDPVGIPWLGSGINEWLVMFGAQVQKGTNWL